MSAQGPLIAPSLGQNLALARLDVRLIVMSPLFAVLHHLLRPHLSPAIIYLPHQVARKLTLGA